MFDISVVLYGTFFRDFLRKYKKTAHRCGTSKNICEAVIVEIDTSIDATKGQFYLLIREIAQMHLHTVFCVGAIHFHQQNCVQR